MTTKMISDVAYLETLERYEREDEVKQKRRSILEQKRKNKKTRKELTFSKSESDESMKKNISLPLEDSTEEVEENDDEMNESNLEEFLLNLWKSLSPLTEESDIKSKRYAFIFEQYKKKYLYRGRAIQCFLVDENGKIEYLQIDCLKHHIGSGTVLESIPEHLLRDIYALPIL